MGIYTRDFLRMLRNQVPIDKVIKLLTLETRPSKNLLRFRCPLCHRFHTGTNPKTNLARCFDCQKNFNPIDLVIDVSGGSFIDAVKFLKKQVSAPDTQR